MSIAKATNCRYDIVLSTTFADPGHAGPLINRSAASPGVDRGEGQGEPAEEGGGERRTDGSLLGVEGLPTAAEILVEVLWRVNDGAAVLEEARTVPNGLVGPNVLIEAVEHNDPGRVSTAQ
ncbi:hypothetical protein ACQP2P_25815 [Dactylosporangium sp. CA-139114]|uniref:hypothetical protein n=1 Tax=Dactylosporangium sp. CA-139114 TaxID=3239931 RepID=UPI003D99CA84